jgi:hypothetical protein
MIPRVGLSLSLLAPILAIPFVVVVTVLYNFVRLPRMFYKVPHVATGEGLNG